MDDATLPPPAGPRLAVLAVVTRAHASGTQVLLVRRANPPQAGLWGFPGGKVEWGEPLTAAAVRELYEETGVTGANPRVFEAIDLIEGGLIEGGLIEGGLIEGGRMGAGHHHLMVAVRLDWQAGEPAARDDALAACWAAPAALPRPLCADVERVVERVVGQVGGGPLSQEH